MTTQKLTLEDFAPLVDTLEIEEQAQTAYDEKYKAACLLLNRIEERQQQDAEKISVMLDELRAEETALRRKVREDANRRAKALLSGQQPPETDKAAGARLAAIPDERIALEALLGAKEMTPEEKEAWETAHSYVVDAEKRVNAAKLSATSLYMKWREYFTKPRFGSPVEKGASRLLEKAYSLNSRPLEPEDDADDYEVLPDDSEEENNDE